MIDPRILERLKAIVGPKGWLSTDDDVALYVEEPRGLYTGATPLVLRPVSTQEVSDIVTICAAESIAIVPQGGNTSLCGASVPDGTGNQIVVNLSRMNSVRNVDEANATLIAETGCVLADLQAQAADVDRLFALSFAAEGSAQVGGFLSTNAGGTNVLRYGNARDHVLGLEVVLPDGRIWDGLRTLRKDNTGYDLKHMFLGAEGTLGIITAASFKLFPRPKATVTAFLAVANVTDAVSLLSLARDKSGDMVTAFELMPRSGLEMVIKHNDGTRDPMDTPHPWYVLMELSSGLDQETLQIIAAQILEVAFDDALVMDGVVANSAAQGAALWQLRHLMSETQKKEGASIKHDVSVPVSRVAEFIDLAMAAVVAKWPGVRPVPFGHVGDGNIHFNISQPIDMGSQDFLALWSEMNDVVHDIVVQLGGSISAEHGIGQLKRDLLPRYKSAVEMDMMRDVKRMLDPNGIMNPNKVLKAE